ncbi:MAG: peptidase [Gracilibacter sp. BRH_c7a]|nr:MAG: peptidase [Gracilibacter sp. BRH_c7a]
MIYLDITLIINAVMDAFLLLFTAHLLRRKVYPLNLCAGVVIGSLPIFVIIFQYPILTLISKVLVPIGMVAITLRSKNFWDLAKGILYFSLLAAICGGLFYALLGWLGISGINSFYTFWILPLASLILIGGYRIWEKSSKNNQFLDSVIFDAEISFEEGKSLTIKALLDTGNDLRDPLTGAPVMLLEERTAREILPEKILEFLQLPWKENPNPWSILWKSDEYYLQKIVFISAKGVNGQSWLLGIRLGKVKISQGGSIWEEQPITVALVEQVLNSEHRFQALLHPEQIQKPVNKEEIAS